MKFTCIIVMEECSSGYHDIWSASASWSCFPWPSLKVLRPKQVVTQGLFCAAGISTLQFWGKNSAGSAPSQQGLLGPYFKKHCAIMLIWKYEWKTAAEASVDYSCCCNQEQLMLMFVHEQKLPWKQFFVWL